MIKYCLKCKNCSLEFESWFSSSKEFDRLKKLKHLNCQNCNSIKIEKSLMTPNLTNTKKKTFEQNEQKLKEVKELTNEGIETEMIPWINDKEN